MFRIASHWECGFACFHTTANSQPSLDVGYTPTCPGSPVRKRTTWCLGYLRLREDFPANNIPVAPLTQKIFMCQFATGPTKRNASLLRTLPTRTPPWRHSRWRHLGRETRRNAPKRPRAKEGRPGRTPHCSAGQSFLQRGDSRKTISSFKKSQTTLIVEIERQ